MMYTLTLKGTTLVYLSMLFQIFSVPVQGTATTDPFYIIAHMANNNQSLDWVVAQGANAIENDLQFDSNGNPSFFGHGGFICDCLCAPLAVQEHICNSVLLRKCSGSEVENRAADHMQKVAHLTDIALYIIDSKVDASMGSKLSIAGASLIPFLDQNLFAYGYRGQLVISTAQVNTFDYLQAAAIAARNSIYESHYFFTFDQENNDYSGVMGMVSRFTNNRVYGTGISSCLRKRFYRGIDASLVGKGQGEHGMSYIWTVDDRTVIESYIDRGVQGVMTNRIAQVKEVAQEKGLRLATPNDTIPVATKSVASRNECSCSKNNRGCIISWPAPPQKACKCIHIFSLWCTGWVVSCDVTNPKCQNPDLSRESCDLGRGNCRGY